MQTITVQSLLHKGNMVIGIYYAHNTSLNNIIKKIDSIKWTQTHNCWYLPFTKIAYAALTEAVKDVAIINNKQLSTYLNHQKALTAITPAIPIISMPQQVGKAVLLKIYAENSHVLPNLQQHLQLKAYSNSTIKTYINEVAQLLYMVKATPADTLSTQRIKDYLQYCFTELGLSENTLHSRMNALKFYYEQVLGKEKFFWQVPRPKKPLQLPKVLNESELGKLFNALDNKKHKAMLFTAYSAGLRVSEVAALQIKHIDSERMQIFIQKAKGKKDRYVALSPVLLDILRSYITNYKTAPKMYLFESEQSKTAYPTRTIQQIFCNAKQKAGIQKEVGIHSLRHSFATHLLEKGTDIKYIKDLLGHFDIKTTERYIHVSKKALVNIVSPLDDLFLKGKIDW